MKSRLLVTGSAFAVALVVLVLTLVVGREPREPPVETVIEPIHQPDRQRQSLNTNSEVKYIEGAIRYTQRTDQGIISVRAETYEPLPDGMFDTDRPWLSLTLDDRRLIELRADHARLLAPDHKPRSGTFDGDVMLLLVESDDGRPDPFSVDPNLAAMRCRIDGEVHFDRELGSIKTDSFVHMTTPRVEATGWGMRLSYNIADNKLNRMVGMRRGQLRFRSQDETEDDAESSESDGPTDGGERSEARDTAAAPSQYYRATFHERVVIRNKFATIEADELQIVFQYRSGHEDKGVLKSLSAATPPRRRATDDRLTGPGGAGGFGGVAQAVVAQIVTAALAAQDDEGSSSRRVTRRSIVTPDLDMDVDQTTITWHGVLTVVPIDQPESQEDRLRGPNDILATLHGRPVHVTTPKKQTVTAATIDYLVSSGRLRVTGSTQEPFLLESPDMAVVVRAPRLVINQEKGTGVIDGPGSVRAHDEPGLIRAVQTDNPLSRWDSRMPAGTSATWADQLRLNFYRRSPDSDSTAPQITGLKDAVFTGAVQINSPGFGLQTDRLTIGLDDPAKHEKQNVDQILAEGHVTVRATGEAPGESLQVQSDRLEVELHRHDDGSVQPTRLIALSQDAPVTAQSPAARLSAGRLEVSLHQIVSSKASRPDDFSRLDDAITARPAPVAVNRRVASAPGQIVATPLFEDGPALDPVDGEPSFEPVPSYRTPQDRQRVESDEPTKKTSFAARIVTAEQDVIIDLTDPKTRVTAARVVADVEAQRVELFGNDEQPAKAEQPDGTLIGHYMVMTQQSETMRILGPGRAVFYERPRPMFTRADNDAPAVNGAAVLDVAWHDRMQFDHKNGLVQFMGNAVIRSEMDKDTLHLSGREVRVKFSNAPGSRRGADRSEGRRESSALERLKHSRRSVRSLVVQDNMRFLAENWLDRPGGTLASSVLIKGPSLRFDGKTEQIRVPGRGSMVFVDQRRKTPGRTRGKDTAASDSPLVSFSGQGNTLFEWVGDLTLDARHNDVAMRDQVKMTHLPAGKDEVLILDCRRLLADLEATGGLKAWMGDNVPRPDVKAVVAEGDVRVQHGSRSVHTDQLKYTGADDMVTLSARQGRLTQVVDSGATNFSAQSMLWNLRTDRFEARDLGAVRFAP